MCRVFESRQGRHLNFESGLRLNAIKFFDLSAFGLVIVMKSEPASDALGFRPGLVFVGDSDPDADGLSLFHHENLAPMGHFNH